MINISTQALTSAKSIAPTLPYLPTGRMLAAFFSWITVAAALPVIPVALNLESLSVHDALVDTTVFPPPSSTERTIRLPCSQCPGNEPELHITLTIESGQHLTLNGFEIYPQIDPWRYDLVGSIYDTDGLNDQQKLGYSIASTLISATEDKKLKFIDVSIQIVEFGSLLVNEVPAIVVRLVDMPMGGIIMGNVEVQAQDFQRCATASCHLQQKLQTLRHTFKNIPPRLSKIWACDRTDGSCLQTAAWSLHTSSILDDDSEHRIDSSRPGFTDSPRRTRAMLIKKISAYLFLPMILGVGAAMIFAV